jgi:mono/diheme cytochrome c family protein
MRCTSALVLASLTVAALVACGGETEAEREAREAQARADTVSLAESLFDASAFDTLSWESPERRLERGGVVYRASCEKCHGARGGGNGEVAMQFQIEVPSFADPNWRFVGDLPGLRQAIFVGHEGAMPSWGLYIKYRDVDAVAGFIVAGIARSETGQD